MATVRELLAKYRAKAEAIREELRFRGCATGEELEAYWPGGSENPGKDIDAWIYCYASMVRFCDRLDDARIAGARAPDSEEEVLRALADATETVTLSTGEKVILCPKSFEALRVIEKLDHRIHWLTDKRAQLAARGEYDDVQLLERTVVEISFLYSLIVWAATHEGVGLPFAEDDDAPKIPDRIAAYSPTDYLLVRAGFLRVNAFRLHILLSMLSEKEAPDPAARQTWATFFSLKEEESHGQSTAKSLMRDRSLASQLASSLLAADVRTKAQEKAEREHEAKAVA